MKRILTASLLAAILGGCAIVPMGYGDNRGGYERGDGYHRSYDYNRGDGYYRHGYYNQPYFHDQH